MLVTLCIAREETKKTKRADFGNVSKGVVIL